MSSRTALAPRAGVTGRLASRIAVPHPVTHWTQTLYLEVPITVRLTVPFESHFGARMFVIKQAGIGIATMSDLKTHAKQTLAATKDARIYVLNDGKPIAGLVSLELMAMIEEFIEDRALAQVAMERHAAIEAGDDALLEEDEFFAAADLHFAKRAAAPRKAAVKKARPRAVATVG